MPFASALLLFAISVQRHNVIAWVGKLNVNQSITWSSFSIRNRCTFIQLFTIIFFLFISLDFISRWIFVYPFFRFIRLFALFMRFMGFEWDSKLYWNYLSMYRIRIILRVERARVCVWTSQWMRFLIRFASKYVHITLGLKLWFAWVHLRAVITIFDWKNDIPIWMLALIHLRVIRLDSMLFWPPNQSNGWLNHVFCYAF